MFTIPKFRHKERITEWNDTPSGEKIAQMGVSVEHSPSIEMVSIVQAEFDSRGRVTGHDTVVLTYDEVDNLIEGLTKVKEIINEAS